MSLWFSPADAVEVTPPAVHVVETQVNSLSLEPPTTGLVEGEEYEDYEYEYDDEEDDDDEWDWKGSDITKRYNSMNRPGLNSQVGDESAFLMHTLYHLDLPLNAKRYLHLLFTVK